MGRTRRGALAAGLAGVGTLSVAGCLSSSESSGVSVLAAGSLQVALEERFRDQVDVDLTLEARGSAACARMVREGIRDPDVLALADPVLFTGVAERYTAFATNALVVAYNPEGAGGAIADAERAYDPLLDADLQLGRTDPETDPLGYRTLFSLWLAEDHWGRPYSDALDRSQILQETALLSAFETGALDAAVAYRNMAVDHDVQFRELPMELNLSAPRFADEYASQSYETPDGQSVTGAPISYGATARSEGAAVADVFEELVSADWLGTGFTVPGSYPTTADVGADGSA
ncbi:MAG: extracellular solute-binding protein [Halolamina sp.]|uniref:extracellular solute-binding protein n=1 Tax=Halolamina sp. TaxID=1940283 RepID=UPI002FC27BB8